MEPVTRPRLATLTAAAVLLLNAPAAAQQPPAPDKPGQSAQEKPPSSSPPSPQKIEEARAHFTRGTELYTEGSYDLALIEFQRSYELAPSFMILYNMAQGSAQVGNHAQALRYFERYLAEGGEQVPAKRRAEVTKEIAFLKARTAQLDIEVNVQGAEVTVDDVPLGVSPFSEPVLVNAGKRVIAVTKPGHVAARKVLTLAGGDQLKISFELPEVAPPPGPTIVRPVERTIVQTHRDEPGTPAYVWLGWVTTGALTAAAAVTGILTLSKHNQYQELKESEITKQQMDDASSELKTFALATDILAGSAIVVGGVSLVLTVTAGSSSKKPNTGSTAAVRVEVAPRGVHVTGAF